MRILFCGNTAYLSDSALRDTFECDQLVIWGGNETSDEKAKNIRHIGVKGKKESYSSVLGSRETDVVVYLSRSLTPGAGMGMEMNDLSDLLLAMRGEKQSRLIYVRLSACAAASDMDNAIVNEAIERLCRSRLEDGKLTILESPYLYRADGQDPFFTPLFETLKEEKRAGMPFPKALELSFLAAEDLLALLAKLCHDTASARREVMKLEAASSIKIQALCECIAAHFPGANLRAEEGKAEAAQEEHDPFVRETYGWFARYSLEKDIPRMIQNTELTAQKGILGWLSAKFRRMPKAVRTAMEVIAAALIAEICMRLSANHVQFSLVDFRLLFVVLIGSAYGMKWGVAAAGIASVMLYLAYQASGRNGLLLFYEPSNWIAFIAYIAAGATCGFTHLTNRNKIVMLQKQNDALREKYLFLLGLYEEGQEERKAYKKQILSTKDSFSRVFDVAQRLGGEDRTQIYGQAIYAMEELLENESIAIYSIGRNPYYARLEACSRAVRGQTKASIRLEDYADMVSCVRDGGVYVNREMKEGYPAYALGICDEGRLCLIVLLSAASPEQMSLYYLNLFRMVGDQIRTAMVRSIRFDALMQDKRYFEGTAVMRPEFFMQSVKAFRENAQADLAEGIVLRLNCGAEQMEEASRKLIPVIRENDVLGLGEDDRLYLLLRQINRQNVDIVTERIFRSSGLTGEVLDLDALITQDEN